MARRKRLTPTARIGDFTRRELATPWWYSRTRSIGTTTPPAPAPARGATARRAGHGPSQ